MDWVRQTLKQQLATVCSGLRDLASLQDSIMLILGSQVAMLLQKLDIAVPTMATLNVGPVSLPVMAPVTLLPDSAVAIPPPAAPYPVITATVIR